MWNEWADRLAKGAIEEESHPDPLDPASLPIPKPPDSPHPFKHDISKSQRY